MNAQTPSSRTPTPLTALAVTAEPLLRALKADPDAKPSALAEASGRLRNHIARDLKALEDAGLIDGRQLTPAGEAQLLMLERAAASPGEAPPAAGPAAEGIVGLLHAQIHVGDRNPRRDWDSPDAKEALEELAASIEHEGRILQNLVVRPRGPMEDWNTTGPDGELLPLYELVAGERRWRAVARLIETGTWPRDRPLPALVTDLDDAGHDRVALIENLKRRDLKPLEEARAFRRLVDGGMKTAELAETINCTQRLVQQRLQLLELDEADQALLDQGTINIEEARRRIANKPQPIEITAEQELVFLELAYAIAKAGNDRFWHDLPIDYRTPARLAEDGDLEWLDRWTYCGSDYSTGQATLRLNYSAHALLRQLTGTEDLTASRISEPLTKARVRAAPGFDARANPLSAQYDPDYAYQLAGELEARARFMTDFLNPPFSIDPDLAAQAQERRERQKAEEQARQKAHAEQKAREAARKGAADQVKELALNFEDKTAAAPEKVASTLSAYGHPLPWTWRAETDDDYVALLDAAGEEINLEYDADNLLALIMASVNAAGGFAPVVMEAPARSQQDAEDEDDFQPTDDRPTDDRPTFVGWIAEALQESLPHWKPERCRSQAGHILDDYLKEQAIEFAADSHNWHRAAATSIADEAAEELEDHAADPDDAQDGDGEFDEDFEADEAEGP